MAKVKQDQFLIINNNKFKVITPPVIQSDNKFIYIEEIKDSGVFKLLSSYSNITPSSIQSISLQTNLNEPKIDVVFTLDDGTHETICVSSVTKLNIGKRRFIFIEEHNEGIRLTYTNGISEDILGIKFMEIQRS